MRLTWSTPRNLIGWTCPALVESGLAQSVAIFSNWAGLVKSRAEWRRSRGARCQRSQPGRLTSMVLVGLTPYWSGFVDRNHAWLPLVAGSATAEPHRRLRGQTHLPLRRQQNRHAAQHQVHRMSIEMCWAASLVGPAMSAFAPKDNEVHFERTGFPQRGASCDLRDYESVRWLA
jgi:hypothetical protein